MSSQEVVLDGVGQILLILSGKGGVGKSTVAVQLAAAIRLQDYKVGILDVDLCGPSIPKMTGVEGRDVLMDTDGRWVPVFADKDQRLSIMSIGFFLNSRSDAVIWRGPKKNSMIKQLLTSVKWDVDYLIIDTPPGTSDEHISVMENIRQLSVREAILVTTPQLVSVDDVTRELMFCHKTRIKVVGIIENMSGFICPNCLECSNIFASGGGEQMALKFNQPFLGRIPIDPNLTKCMEEGDSYIDKFVGSPISSTFVDIVNTITGGQFQKTEMES